MHTLRLGTRGSPLALFQANAVSDLLRARANVDCEIVIIKTSGDRLSEMSLREAGGKRSFVKEIEDALLAKEVDLAVHSSKDMSAMLPDGLEVGAVLPREDARDALVLATGHGTGLDIEAARAILGTTPRIGTSSVRRMAQLVGLSPGATFAPIRGNLDTRLRKLDAGDYDALVLAAAGLRRLTHESRISALLPVELSVPAPGQGIIAIEIRKGDPAIATLIRTIDDAAAAVALRAERTVVERLGGGCQMPLGAYASDAGGRLSLRCVVVSPDGMRTVRAQTVGSIETPEQVGIQAADELLAQGADEILADARRSLSAPEGYQP